MSMFSSVGSSYEERVLSEGPKKVWGKALSNGMTRPAKKAKIRDVS
jgi:hypothetical protein